MIEPRHLELSIARQCELLGLARSTCYYPVAGETAENLALMRAIDKQYLATPFYGSRKIALELGVNRKRVQRLMRIMGLEAIYAKRRTTRPAESNVVTSSTSPVNTSEMLDSVASFRSES